MYDQRLFMLLVMTTLLIGAFVKVVPKKYQWALLVLYFMLMGVCLVVLYAFASDMPELWYAVLHSYPFTFFIALRFKERKFSFHFIADILVFFSSLTTNPDVTMASYLLAYLLLLYSPKNKVEEDTASSDLEKPLV